MGSLVVRLQHNQYVKWSNTVDAPVSPVCTRETLIALLETEDEVSFSEASRLMDLADQGGTSDPHVDLATLLSTNRAGPAEEILTLDEIIRMYSD